MGNQQKHRKQKQFLKSFEQLAKWFEDINNEIKQENGLKDNEYICDMCKNKYEKLLTEEEAIAEKDKYFPDISLDECGIVCDDCYKSILN
jgi:hypothetical protein